jgi:anti-sigma regulatory factor (Ser/Thr protein kinase)
MSEWNVLAELTLPSVPGNERQAMRQVAEAVAPLELPGIRLERLKTAVAEATMNAMEHGNRYTAGLDVHIEVAASPAAVRVRITDHGGNKTIPATPDPNIDAKLAGEQSPRGWGLFLIRSMVHEIHTTADEAHHTIELIVERGKES